MKKIIAFSTLSLFLTTSGLAQANTQIIIKNDTDQKMELSTVSHCSGNQSAIQAFPQHIAAHNEQTFTQPDAGCTVSYAIPPAFKKDFFINSEPGKKPLCTVNAEKGNSLTCAVSAVNKNDYRISWITSVVDPKSSSPTAPTINAMHSVNQIHSLNNSVENTALESIVPRVNSEEVHKAATEASQFVEDGMMQIMNMPAGVSTEMMAQQRQAFMQNFNKRYAHLNSTETNQVGDIASEHIKKFIENKAKSKYGTPDMALPPAMSGISPAKGDNSEDNICNKDIKWAFSSVDKALDILQKTETDTKTISGIWMGMSTVALFVIVDTTSGISPNYGVGKKPRGCSVPGSGFGRGILTLATWALDWELGLPYE